MMVPVADSQPKEPVPVEPAKKQGEPTIEQKRAPSETSSQGLVVYVRR